MSSPLSDPGDVATCGPPERLRVMRIISRMNVGGPARHVAILHRGLDPKRFEPVLVYGAEGSNEGTLRELVGDASDTVSIPELGREISPVADSVTLVRLVRLMRKTRPHVVHTHTAKAGFVGRLAARITGVPVIVHTFHGHVFHGYFSPRKTATFLRLERFCAGFSSRLVTISPRLREEIAAYGVAGTSRIEVVPLGLHLAPHAAHPRRDGAFRRDLGIGDDAFLIGAVGRLVPIKNLELLLEAASVARGRVPHVQVVFVGDGELRAALAARAAALGLADAVTFAGWRSDLPAVYADLDATIISSHNEGTPACLIEAMASGCPVIATRVGGVPDMIEAGITGQLTPPGDATALAAAIVNLVNEPDQARRMADQARGEALARYDEPRLVTDMERLYGQLAREAGLPGWGEPGRSGRGAHH
ncbi:MAG: glycosyltransferase [Thermomicrobiales bacterium]|nr:glycosyltransferase [Thermomicrobiales bacterium]